MSTLNTPMRIPQNMGIETTISQRQSLRPMGWDLSLLCFGVPSTLSILVLHVATPILVAGGMRPFYAQLIPNTVLLASLLIASVVAYRLENRPMTWAGLKDRFRLKRMTGESWLWVLGGTKDISC